MDIDNDGDRDHQTETITTEARRSMLDQLIDAIHEQAPSEGPNTTFLDNVMLFRVSERVTRVPLIYDQCICIAAQGHKTCHLTDSVFTYGADNLLVVPTVVPVEIEIVPDPGVPLLSLTMPINFQMVRELMEAIHQHDSEALSNPAPSPGVYLEPMTSDITEPVLRLLQTLKSKGEAKIFGEQILREIHYRLLMGENGHILASAAKGESSYALISQALRTIHDNYTNPIDVQGLADGANMSSRSFYDHFKAVTSHTPVQYLKRIRLEKARQFMVNQGEKASSAAYKVGYESPSQFSREFKRHFGYTPSEAMQNSQYMAV